MGGIRRALGVRGGMSGFRSLSGRLRVEGCRIGREEGEGRAKDGGEVGDDTPPIERKELAL